MKNKNIKKMVGIALFAAIIVVLQVISGVIFAIWCIFCYTMLSSNCNRRNDLWCCSWFNF
ncbi:MAG: hypothetical protein L6U99_12570 [Clostridium sp.]|nr:MAG: hypothetical protein L6U99_12570 [Clostridium sp.]